MEIQEVAVAKLKPWDDNPRLNDNAVGAVAESIKQYGFNVSDWRNTSCAVG